ncbi:hypothetical protein BsWGS_09538 [Bradybaena similaris]
MKSSKLSMSGHHYTLKDETSNRGSHKVHFSQLIASLAVFTVAFVCFANSYDGEFVFDDAEAIENNKDLLPTTPVEDLLQHDFWGKKLSNLSHKSYRPLTVLTFRLNYWAAGGLFPKGFHIVNILLHGAVSALLIPFFTLIMLDAGGSDGESKYAAAKWPFLCSILFAVHPVHTESVAGVVGRAELLCALFFILSFLLYVKACTRDSACRPEGFSFIWLCLSLVCCGLATFSKEQGITVIGVCSVYDVVSICRVDLGVLFGFTKSRGTKPSLQKPVPSAFSSLSNGASLNKQGGGSTPQWPISLVKRHILLTAAGVLLLVIRWKVMGSSPPTFQIHDNPHSFVNGSVYRVLNYNYLYAINAWILLSPHWLCFDWSMGCVPTITALDDPRLIAVVLFWLMLLLLLWTCLCSESAATRRAVTLAIAIMVVPYLPATNILFRVGFVVAERVLYLPSAGFCLLVVLGLRRICSYDKLATVAMIGFILLVLVFAIRSIQRSNEWRKGIWLFRAGEKVCPNNAKVHYNIGKLCADNGETEEAVSRYRLAIELNPLYDQAMNNLANLLKDQGDQLGAELLLDKAVSISPDFAAAWMNRGIVKAGLKKYQDAEYSYKQGLRCRRNYPDCYYNLGNLYIDMGRSQDALDAFHNSTSLKPTHWNAWNNAIVLLDNLGLYDKAVNMAFAALKFLPDNSAIMFTLASCYGKQGKFEDSEKWFLAALQQNPQNANSHLNLGVLYHRWGKYKEANASYQRALQLDPSNTAAADNMRSLKAKMKSS